MSVCLAGEEVNSSYTGILVIEFFFSQSLNTPHFAKVKDFINLQMPSGFPIKFGK